MMKSLQWNKAIYLIKQTNSRFNLRQGKPLLALELLAVNTFEQKDEYFKAQLERLFL